MDIGKRVAEIREQVGQSQSALARAIGISQSAISQIESGERNPSYDMLRQIAKALGVSIPHLVGAEVETLSPTEKVHFRNYRGLSPEAKEEVENFAAYLRQKQAAKKTKG
jgi:transcriptional regulator with XRE-family HTH domain